MSYISLSEHKKPWIFNRTDLPISDDDRLAIKPMTEARAATLWKALISKQTDHPDFFRKGDWPFSIETWKEEGEWESVWDSDAVSLPEMIQAHLPWEANTVVYYCNDQQSVIETTWATFQRCWKNFLFMDDGALLVAKKRPEAVQFLSNGSFRIGTKP
ncbi:MULTISPECIES: DUF2947 family protein [Corallincola]|uniref:DUF2947 family protein n=3 Tax=Corallincola TaxID=1775176 RepID=A0A368N517_9GAMM|nr:MULTISPECIES: DUF2947 family protein [Corallincola]RCU45306.1 DUF2947 family protein [Corallincola holothuriorum]TAA42583.1 DUF2947 family protein [Corallincola spongiicola]TCI01290.1 DUF2947 family protein [Corallincola luteus]